MAGEQLCYRCGVWHTAKRVDNVPVCQQCFIKDSAANNGIVPDYSHLTPVGVSTVKKPAIRRKTARNSVS